MFQPMRGTDTQQSSMFSYLSPEERVPANHPLRPIRLMVDDALKALSPAFSRLYSDFGRPSIPPEKLLRALLLQVLYTVRSERMLMAFAVLPESSARGSESPGRTLGRVFESSARRGAALDHGVSFADSLASDSTSAPRDSTALGEAVDADSSSVAATERLIAELEGELSDSSRVRLEIGASSRTSPTSSSTRRRLQRIPISMERGWSGTPV